MTTVSFKLPLKDLRRIPSRNRSAFFRAAVQEKLAQPKKGPAWKPKGAAVKKMLALRAAHLARGARTLAPEEILEELRQRRGGLA